MDVQAWKQQLDRDGFAIVPSCLDENTLKCLCAEFGEGRESQRNALNNPSVLQLATSAPVRAIMESALGKNCFAVRGIFFNKTQDANWKVIWHQDLTISVCERKNADGFGPWTIKDGVIHVQPPAEIMSQMLAIRLHLDDSEPDNGPVRVIPGTHKHGRLSANELAATKNGAAVTCCVPRGGALLMRPLLLHASSSCAVPKPRRVIHIEFAAVELPDGLEWHERI
jgi:ectoine hydroxylase-related dioxygenase (phytanoyl-CoA dioxygenase family)